MPKTGSAVAKSKKAGALASSGKSRKAAEDAKNPYTGHENLSPAEIEATRQYQGHLFNPINEFLRGQRASILSMFKEHIPHLESAIAKTIITQDVTLYRGTGAIPGVKFSELKPGHIITDKGFHSTSISKSSAEKFHGIPDITGEHGALLSIKVRKGSKGLAVHQVDTGSSFNKPESHNPEYEVLLPRGSTFKVNRVRKLKSGHYHVSVTLQ